MPVVSIVTAAGVVFTFDSVRELRLSGSATVTDHPTEDGRAISDNSRRNPRRLSLTGCVVTETPRAYLGEAGGPDRPLRALEFLDSLSGQQVAIVTEKLGTFLNMEIVEWPTGVDRVRRLAFNVEFKQVRIAVATSIAVPESATTSGLAAGIDAGEQALLSIAYATAATASATAPASSGTPPAQDAANKSVLASLVDAFGAA